MGALPHASGRFAPGMGQTLISTSCQFIWLSWLKSILIMQFLDMVKNKSSLAEKSLRCQWTLDILFDMWKWLIILYISTVLIIVIDDIGCTSYEQVRSYKSSIFSLFAMITSSDNKECIYGVTWSFWIKGLLSISSVYFYNKHYQ